MHYLIYIYIYILLYLVLYTILYRNQLQRLPGRVRRIFFCCLGKMSTQVRTLAMVVNAFNIYLYTYIWYCIVLDDLIVQYSKEFCIEWHCARAAARASSERFFFHM